MTFCIGIKSKTGVVGLADTRISSGLGVSTSKKVVGYKNGNNTFFMMSSGLRSIRDKVKNYFDDALETEFPDKLYKGANLLGDVVKKVRKQDVDELKASNLIFDAHFIIGGQCERDKRASLFLILPEGNWIEVSDESPYALIGNTGFGKPILRRLLHEEITFDLAIKAAYLSFDATLKNASDVDFPVDFMLYKNDSFELMQFRKSEEELKSTSKEWNSRLVDAANELPQFIHIDD